MVEMLVLLVCDGVTVVGLTELSVIVVVVDVVLVMVLVVIVLVVLAHSKDEPTKPSSTV